LLTIDLVGGSLSVYIDWPTKFAWPLIVLANTVAPPDELKINLGFVNVVALVKLAV
jgi:hypothetical protein